MKKMKKPNIFLDLDQTLISAEPTEEFDFKKYETKQKLFRSKNMDGYYIVFERPHLQDFLDYIFKNFNVSIWTAASKEYALFIIKHIIIAGKKERNLDYIFFSYHCKISNKIKKRQKSLSLLWDVYKLKKFSETNTFILDDYDDVYASQIGNCIKALPFEFKNENSEKDDFLLELKKKLEKNKDKLYIPSKFKDTIKKISS